MTKCVTTFGRFQPRAGRAAQQRTRSVHAVARVSHGSSRSPTPSAPPSPPLPLGAPLALAAGQLK
eukprot:2684731-Prymnesium_polylepis.1